MGSGNQNYSDQINTALAQANMPKSPLAQQLSNNFSQNFQQTLAGVLSGGGNAFQGINGGQSTPGQILNGGGYQQSIFNPSGSQPAQSNPVLNSGTATATTSNLNNSTAQSNPGNLSNGINLSGINSGLLSQLTQQFGRPGEAVDNASQSLFYGLGGSNALSQNQNNIPGLSSNLQQALNNTNQASGLNPNSLQTGLPQNVNVNPANLQTGLPNAQDSAYYQGVEQTLGNQYNQGLKDLQARFGAAGGTSRGTPAAFAQAQYSAQALPQLAAALGNVRQQEVGNQLQAQNQGNSANLTARGQDISNAQQNVGNQLQGQNQSNQALLQNQGLNNQAVLDRLNSISGLFGQQGNLNNQLLGNLGNIAANSGQTSLGVNQLNTGNQLATNQLNSQNINNALSQLGNLQNNNNQTALGLNQLLANNSQFNAGQQNSNLQALNQLLAQANQFNAGQQNLNTQQLNQLNQQNSQFNADALTQNRELMAQLGLQNNQFNSNQFNNQALALLQLAQQGNQQQINNQFTGLQNVLQLAGQFGLAGIPGGSANVNLSASPQSGGSALSGIGSALGGLGSLIGAL